MELLKAHLRPLFYLLNKFFFVWFFDWNLSLCGDEIDDDDAPIH